MRCHTSIAKTLGLLILGMLMVALSWFCTTIPRLFAQIFGWFGVVFFGLCLIAIATQLVRRVPTVIIDDSGITDRREAFGLVPWTDIVSLRIRAVHNQRFLCVEVVDAAPYLARLPAYKRAFARANASLGFPPVTIGFSGLKPGLDEVWSYLKTNHEHKIAA